MTTVEKITAAIIAAVIAAAATAAIVAWVTDDSNRVSAECQAAIDYAKAVDPGDFRTMDAAIQRAKEVCGF